MLRERVARHFSSRGWTVEEDVELPSGGGTLKADLVVKKGAKSKAVRISEEDGGLSRYEVAKFAAQCKKAGVSALVVCDETPVVLEACDEAAVEFLAPQGLGAVVALPEFKRPPAVPAPTPAALTPPLATRVSVAPRAEPVPAGLERSSIPWWRWAIVALVWAAALYFVVQFVLEVRGGP